MATRSDRKVFSGAALWAALSVWQGRMGGPLQDRLMAPHQEEVRTGPVAISARLEGAGVVVIVHDALAGTVTEDWIPGEQLELVRVIPLEAARKELAQDEKRLAKLADERLQQAEEARLAAEEKARVETEKKRIQGELEAAARKIGAARNEATAFADLEDLAKQRAVADGIEFGQALGIVVAEINAEDWVAPAASVAVPASPDGSGGNGLTPNGSAGPTLAELAGKGGE